MSRKKKLCNILVRSLLIAASLCLAAVIWSFALGRFYRPNVDDFRPAQGLGPMAIKVAERHLAIWRDDSSRENEWRVMRATNAEWDFMGRTFLVLSLTNMALRDPENREDYVALTDKIIDDTLKSEKEKGQLYFLMDYAKDSEFVVDPPRSIFIDGEISIMLGARCMVQRRDDYVAELSQRVDSMVPQMEKSRVLCGESYPDECWLFCNMLAVTSTKMSDILDGRDHSDFRRRWLQSIHANLVDKKTGLLISAFNLKGNPLDGPEGSTIWLLAHCLQVLEPEFARDQYERAKKELGRSICGFGYAREWPKSWEGVPDVDSGPVVPILEASAGSSGLALLGAASFDDREYYGELLASLEFAAFPVEKGDEVIYQASNQVGDAVLLYSMVEGPLWEELRRRAVEAKP